MGTAAPHQAECQPSKARSPRLGSRHSVPLLAWEQERSIILLELKRTELLRRIALLKPRSHARVVLEAELKALTNRALRAESAPETLP